MDLSVEERPGHRHFKTFRWMWEDRFSWEEYCARKPRYRVRTHKEPPSPAPSPPSQTFSASSATPVPPASPAPSSISSGGSVAGSVLSPEQVRRENFRNTSYSVMC